MWKRFGIGSMRYRCRWIHRGLQPWSRGPVAPATRPTPHDSHPNKAFDCRNPTAVHQPCASCANGAPFQLNPGCVRLPPYFVWRSYLGQTHSRGPPSRSPQSGRLLLIWPSLLAIWPVGLPQVGLLLPANFRHSPPPPAGATG